MGCLGTESGKDGGGEIVFDGLAVALVEFTRMVVRGSLGTHVVAASVMKDFSCTDARLDDKKIEKSCGVSYSMDPI